MTVENHTDRTLALSVRDNDTEVDLTVLRPGHHYRTREPCVEAELLLRTEEDREIFARHPGPLCQDDPPWIVTLPSE